MMKVYSMPDRASFLPSRIWTGKCRLLHPARLTFSSAPQRAWRTVASSEEHQGFVETRESPPQVTGTEGHEKGLLEEREASPGVSVDEVVAAMQNDVTNAWIRLHKSSPILRQFCLGCPIINMAVNNIWGSIPV